MSNYNRKYPKVTGSWTYGHIVVQEKLIYIGSSDEPECRYRWKPSNYKTTELYHYIEKHGWDNIEHIVFKDGLTPKQAKQLEDLLITQAKIDGWCINKQGSGLYKKDNPKEYYKQYRENHKEEIKQYREEHKEDFKRYREEHKEEIIQRKKLYRQNHEEEIKQYEKQRRSTPEGKIYYRVNNYNKKHTPIETPLEAKLKYLETGYIPNYIKNNDL